MSARREFVIFLKDLEDGRVLAASNQAPYFCIEGRSESDAREIVHRLLRFYSEKRGQPRQQPMKQVQVSAFKPSRIIRQEELQYA